MGAPEQTATLATRRFLLPVAAVRMETPPDLPQGPSTKLFLGGLPPGVTNEDLRDHFETFGKVDEAVVKMPQGTSWQSHFGFLWVRPAEAARQIVAQDHTIHCASGLSVTIPAPVLARNTPLSTAWHTFGQQPALRRLLTA